MLTCRRAGNPLSIFFDNSSHGPRSHTFRTMRARYRWDLLAVIERLRLRRIVLGLLIGGLVTGCSTTSRIEPYKSTNSVIQEGERVVILARKHHASYEAEQDFIECIAAGLAGGDDALDVHPTVEFEDKLYPWFEPSTAPLSTDDLSELLEQPRVTEQIRRTGVRYIVWLDGSTERISSGGGISCAAGVGGAGCLGLAWWEDEARYDATVWDIEELVSAGTIYADVKGRSVMPALIIPLPFIARPRAAACRGLTEQLKAFLTTGDGYGVGPDPTLNPSIDSGS